MNLPSFSLLIILSKNSFLGIMISLLYADKFTEEVFNI
jgi:hypothetical protein